MSKFFKFFNPLFIIDMMLKTVILFFISFHLSGIVDQLFPSVDDKKDTIIIWLEVLSQAAVCAIIAFYFRTLLEFFGNKFDVLSDDLSKLSAKGASLIVSLSFFALQKSFKDKVALLRNRYTKNNDKSISGGQCLS